MKNLKDVLSTICGIIIAICWAGTGLIWQLGVTLPAWVTPTALALAGLAAIVVTYLQGKNADGTTKTPEQLELQNYLANCSMAEGKEGSCNKFETCNMG